MERQARQARSRCSDTETDNERFRTKQLSPTVESFNQMAQESVEVSFTVVNYLQFIQESTSFPPRGFAGNKPR